MTAPADPRLGTRLAGYQIKAPLGRGGMGGLPGRAGTPPPSGGAQAAAGPGDQQRDVPGAVLRESELAAAIDHPNVLPVYDAGETDGCCGSPCATSTAPTSRPCSTGRGRWPPNRCWRSAARWRAPWTPHARGLVHRDVKPGNVLLAVEDGSVAHAYLADFGLTRRIGGAQVHDPPRRIGEHRPDLPAALDEVIGRALAKAPATAIRPALPWSPQPRRPWPEPPRPACATASADPAAGALAEPAAGPG